MPKFIAWFGVALFAIGMRRLDVPNPLPGVLMAVLGTVMAVVASRFIKYKKGEEK